jgi:hypothetical protein
MIGARHQPLTAASTFNADSGGTASFSSPPCFLHELGPSYLGYLADREVRALLAELLRAKLTGTRIENAWAHAMLLRQAARMDGRGTFTSPGASRALEPEGTCSLQPLSASEQERLEAKLEDALPRLQDPGLRQDLEQVLRLLKRDKQGAERHSNG